MNARRFVLASLPGDPERNALLLSDWDCEMVGEQGALMLRGPEVHAIGVGLTRRRLRDTLERLITSYGFAQTTVEPGNTRSENFVRRLGFSPVETGVNGTIFRIERIDLCPQLQR